MKSMDVAEAEAETDDDRGIIFLIFYIRLWYRHNWVCCDVMRCDVLCVCSDNYILSSFSIVWLSHFPGYLI